MELHLSSSRTERDCIHSTGAWKKLEQIFNKILESFCKRRPRSGSASRMDHAESSRKEKCAEAPWRLCREAFYYSRMQKSINTERMLVLNFEPISLVFLVTVQSLS